MRSLIISMFLLFVLVVSPKHVFAEKLTGFTHIEVADIYYAPFFNDNGLFGTFGGYFGGDSDSKIVDWSIGNTTPHSDSATDDIVFSTSTGNIMQAANWKERMRITKDGKVGINTKNPIEKLHITDNEFARVHMTGNDAVGDVEMIIDATASGAPNNQGQIATLSNHPLKFFTNNAFRMEISESGKVGIGLFNPNHPLEMASGAHVTSAGVWTNASSRDYKENIRDLTIEEAKETLEKLMPTKFNYKVEREEEYVGFIAEDVPELVATKDRKSLSPMDIVAVLTKVVQQQQEDIEKLKIEKEQLKENVSTLTKRQKTLETMFLALSTQPKEALVKFDQAGLDEVQNNIQ